MEKNIFVTVIMPSLNVQKYIGECLDSVVRQTLKEIEILCIDAGSTDGTLEILRDYAARDSRIQIINSEVKSYGKQVNMGLDLARGKYIAIVETDDFVDPIMLERLFCVAEKEHLDFVKSDYKSFQTTKNGCRIYNEARIWETDEIYDKVLKVEDFPELYVRDISIWRGLYNKGFLQENQIRLNESSGAAFQDIGFHHLLLLYAKRAVYLKDMLYFYRMDNGESSAHSQQCIYYVFQEYSRLLEISLPDVNTVLFYRYLYIRMAIVFIGEYEKFLSYNVETTRELRKCIEWFKKLLGDKIRQQELQENDVGEETWRRLCLFLKDEEAYAAQRRYVRNLQKEKDAELLDLIGPDEITIFGCGQMGKAVLLFCSEHDIRIAAFSDNNPKLWGKEYYGYPVCAPAELQTKYPEAKILISSRKYAAEIREQLSGLGIPGERVLDLEGSASSGKEEARDLIHFTGCVPNISITAGPSYQTRAEASIDFTVKALMEYLPLSGKQVDFYLYTGDKSDEAERYRKQLQLDYIFAYSTKEAFPNVIAVPDFIYSSWKESGVSFWEDTAAACIREGGKPYTDERLYWIGNVNTHATRKNLVRLSQQYPELILAEGMEWLDDKKGKKLQATKFVPLYEQAKYKYLIDVQGNGYSGRLKLLLFMGRPVFIAKRVHRDFYFSGLRDMENCVFVEEDMSDLPDKLRLLNGDEALYQHIVQEGRRFADSCLSKPAALAFYGEKILEYGCR